MASSPLFGFAPAASSSPAFGASPFQVQNPQIQQQQQLLQQQQQQPQQPQQISPLAQAGQLNLVTNDRNPLTYNTRWAEIHPDSQKLLQKIEEKILEYRDECGRLERCERLYDTSALSKGFELDAARISQELSGVGIAIEREQASLQELMKSAKEMLRNTEVAVRSFIMLSARFPRPSTNPSGAAAATTPAPGMATQTPPPVYVSDFYSGVPVKPSPYFQQTVAKFESRLTEYKQWVEELERLLLRNDKDDGRASDMTILQSLPEVMSNVHDFFIYVAAEVESLHEFLESMRLAFLADQRRRGDDNNPFLEADRRETAKREAAAKRVHPSALKPPESTASQTPGLLPALPPANSATQATQVSSTPSQAPSLFAPSTSPALYTPSATATATSLFATPSSGLFGTTTTSTTSAPKPKPRNSRRK